MNSLARHADTAQQEQSHNRVELKNSSSSPGTQRQVLQNPTLADPIRHQKGYGERCRDGCSFGVFTLSRGVLGDVSDGDVEACKSSQAAEDEECKEEVVGWGSKSNSKC